jgi:hypothetical protein
MANDILKQLGLIPEEEENLSPVMLQNPAVVENAAPIHQIPVQNNVETTPGPINVSSQIQKALANQQGIGKIVAPQIPAVQEDPEERKARMEREKAIFDKLNGLDTEYKKQMQDADDRKFNSSIFAAIGNYLPQAIAGATAMNTKAAVQAPNLPKITPTDDTGRVSSKYKTDYENLLNQYKAIKDGKLTAKDELNRLTTNAYLQAGADKQNSTNANAATNANLRGTGLGLKAEKDSELSDKQVESLAGYDDTLTSLNRIREQKKKVPTGPLQDRRNKIASHLGIDDPEVTSLRSEVIDTLAAKIKALSGTAANESEVKRLQVTLPEIGDSDEVFERKLNDAEKRIKEARKIREDHYRSKQGKNVEGYNQPKTNEETKTLPDGSTYVKVPGGWKKVK